MSYELQAHTADVAVEATGETLGDAFAAAADGMAAAQCDDIPDAGERFSLSVTAERVEAALLEYLDELILERDLRNQLPVDNEATVSELDGEWTVDATARGVPLAQVTAREIKAVTYSDMAVEEMGAGWRVYVVFDV
ncbi:archease [Haloarcula sp. 1CSR25-25]|uniref:archease n=1 Tax=Haloarcula sp. 1CSR25-25 TaxID=2862545 RepID=UPI00289405A6|nr:archease [Haloarcula sp. 1CSR25-25]MDT3435216.1 archease [Haloarcula sp. 1CSR25-25]